MSWWITLENENGAAVQVANHSEGGTYAIGGTTDAELNVTYNYAPHFGFRSLDGRTGEETIPELEVAVQKLGTERSGDYWESTAGNTGHAIAILLAWAKEHPQAKWRVN